METYIAIILGLLSLSMHELGHYEAMRRCKITVKEVSLLGFPAKGLPEFHYTSGATTWSIYLFLLGAYVIPESGDDIAKQSWRKQLYIHANGPIANFVYALALVGIGFCVKHFESGNIWRASFILVGYSGLAFLMWSIRRYLALVIPVCSIPILALVVYFMCSVSPLQAIENGSGGPIAVFLMLASASSTSGAILMAATFSINLGIINLLPLYPLDGGHMWEILVKRGFGEKLSRVYTSTAFPFFAIIALYVLSLDLIRVLAWIF